MKAHTFFYELVSIVGCVTGLDMLCFDLLEDGMVRVQSMNAKRSIVLDAKTHEPVEGFTHNCGLSSLDRARAMLNAPGMSNSTVESEWMGEESVLFFCGYQRYKLGLMGEAYANQVARPPPLKKQDITYELTAVPTIEGNRLLKHWRKEMPEIWGEPEDFSIDIVTRHNILYATMRNGPREDVIFPLTNIVAGQMARFLRVRSDHLMRLLPLVERTLGTLIHISDAGLVTIEVKTTYLTYEFYVPCFKVDWLEYMPPEWHRLTPR